MKNKIESEKYNNYPPQERALTLFPLSRKERRILHTRREETHSIGANFSGPSRKGRAYPSAEKKDREVKPLPRKLERPSSRVKPSRRRWAASEERKYNERVYE